MSERITAVVGFSRCGTSLMMRMLDMGGVQCLADNKTSYEDERAGLGHSLEWLAEHKGKAVKLLEPGHLALPAAVAFDFIWMRRNPIEQAKSQIKFLRQVAGLKVPNAPAHMALGIIEDTPKVIAKLKALPAARLLEIKFEDLLRQPHITSLEVEEFLNRPLNINLMCGEVRQRSTDCYPGFLELEFLNR